MNCKVLVVGGFMRSAKQLAKKYASLKSELSDLQTQLVKNPRMGTLIYENTYKIRLAVKSKGKGKSGGLRVITHIVEVEIELTEISEQEIIVFLTAIYDKSDSENISDKDLKNLISEIHDELSSEE